MLEDDATREDRKLIGSHIQHPAGTIGLGERLYLGGFRTYCDQNLPTVGGPASWNIAEEGYLKKNRSRAFFFQVHEEGGERVSGIGGSVAMWQAEKILTKWWGCAAEVGKGQQQRTMGCTYVPNPAP